MNIRRHFIERLFLLAGSIGWGISIIGTILPWTIMNSILQNMGMKEVISDPQMQYWFRMATGAWGVIGFLYFMAYLRPEKSRKLIFLLAVGTFFEGLVLLVHGLVLSVPLFPFVGDVAFCLIIGLGLLLCHSSKAKNVYPILAERSANAASWQIEAVNPAITAAYLEVIAFAFNLEDPKDLFKLRPEDSLFNLYNSCYGKLHNRFAGDNLEIEECCEAFEKLCRYSGASFTPESTIHEQLQCIAKSRENRPPTAEEIKSLRISMRLLPFISPSAPNIRP